MRRDLERWLINLQKLQQFFYELQHVTAALLQITVNYDKFTINYSKLVLHITTVCYYKLLQCVITNYDSFIINYGKRLLQIAVALLQIKTICYYKLRQLYQIIINYGSFWCYYKLQQHIITNYDVIKNNVVTRWTYFSWRIMYYKFPVLIVYIDALCSNWTGLVYVEDWT